MTAGDPQSERARTGRARLDASGGTWRQLVPILIFLAIGLFLFPSAGRDDKYISYWPAHTLATYGEILNYNGERVEQSSSLLLVVLVASVVKLTPFDPPMAAWLLGVFSGAAALVACGRLAARCEAGGAWPAMLLSSVSGCFVYWSFSGTEVPLVALTATLAVLTSRPLLEGRTSPKAILLSAGALLLFLACRPESPHVALCATAGMLVLLALRRTSWQDKRPSLRGASLLLGEVAVLAACLALFRLLYFDSFLPQPALVKYQGLSWNQLDRGLSYVGRFPWLTPLWLGCIVGLLAAVWDVLRSQTANLTRSLLALFCLSSMGFVVLAGGDWMEGARFIAHVLPLLVVLALSAVFRTQIAGLATSMTAALVALGLLSSVHLAQTQSLAIPFWARPAPATQAESSYSWLQTQNRSQRRDIPLAEAMQTIIGAVLEETPERVYIAAENIGMVIYFAATKYYGRIGTVDLHGLTDRYLTDVAHPRSKPAIFGLMWGPEALYPLFEGLLRPAGVPFPVIAVFQGGSYPARSHMAERLGRRVAYWTRRTPERGPWWMRGRRLGNNQYITVDEKFAKTAENLELEGNSVDRRGRRPRGR